MSSIDERIVRMKFDNGAFHNGVRATLDDLKQLTQGLKLTGASKGLDDVGKAASRFSLAGMGQQVQGVLGQFSALQVVAVTALSNIANKAINAGTTLANSLSVKPIADGLREYETNLNSIQTILANTGLEGQDGLNKVGAKLEELNRYSDQTIYNFSEMARNIGTFTAAGVDLDTSTAAIKGIANLAALSGSNSQQASTAMYQLSQAMAAGKATLVDWNSVVNAGMGGKVFQEALKETARVQGVNVDAIIEKNGSFRDSLQEGWLTTEVLTGTLAKFTGDMTAEQLKALGYSEDQIAATLKMGQTAQDAATKIKTVSQLIGTLQESATSGWAQTWQMVFGDFEEAKTLFTNVNNVLGGMINASSDARNKVIGDWKSLGGREVLIEGLSNAFNALMAVIKPIGAAFRQIFPPATGQQLYDISVAIRDFTANLQIGGTTANNLQRTFAGFFAILGIGWEVIKAAASALLDLLGVATSGSGSFLEWTAGIGDFLVALLEATRNGEGLKKFFSGIASVIKVPIELIKNFASLIANAFDPSGLSNFGDSASNLIGKLNPLKSLGTLIKDVWNGVVNTIKGLAKFLQPAADAVLDFFSGIATSFSDMLGDFDYATFLSTINTGLFAGLLILIKKFTANIFSINIGERFFGTLTDGFSNLTSTLGGMQDTLRAATLLQIAAAIALLAVSLVTLSHIDSDGLIRASAAIGVLFGQLIGATAAFSALGSFKAFAKLPLLGASLILIAAALAIMAQSVQSLSGMNWEELGKGLTGVIVLLGAMAGVAKLLQGNAAGMITAGAGLILLALALKILVSAVKDFAEMDWEGIAKGLVGVAGLLGALALFSKLNAANAGGIAQSVGILLLAAALKVLASAVEDFAAMTWESMAQGLVGVAGGLAIIAGALKLIPPSSILSAAAIFVVAASLGMIGDAVAQMGGLEWDVIGRGMATMAGALVLIGAALILIPPSSLLSAAAILVVAASLGMIADALGQMGSMSWEEIGKSLVLLTGSLALIAGGLYLMTAALPGAAALIVAAAALAILAPVLTSFGGMSWEEIGKGLVMLAGAFTVIGLAGLLLTPVIPSLLLLGAAILLLGVGAAAAGLGVLAFSAGFTALVAAGTAGVAVIGAIVMGLIDLIPEVARGMGEGLVVFAGVIAKAGPAMTQAMTAVMIGILDAVIAVSPKITQTLNTLVTLLIGVLTNSIPRLVNAGLQMIIGILTGIRNNIGQIVTVAGQIIVNFLNAISAQLPKIADAGVKLIISFINSVANAIRSNQGAMEAAGGNLAKAIVQGMVRGIGNGISSVVEAAKGLANKALNAAKNALGIASPSKRFTEIGEFTSEGFAIGLLGNQDKIEAAVDKMVNDLENAMDASTKDIEKAEESLQKLTDARNEDNKAIEQQAHELDKAREADNRAIRDAEGRLAKLRSAKKKDAEAIRKAERDLADARGRTNEAKEVEKLQKMKEARDKENISIGKATAELEELRKERDGFAGAHAVIVNDLAKEHAELLKLADGLEKVKDRLKDANKSLEDAIKTRDDYRDSLSDKYNDLPELEDDLKIEDYASDLRKQIEDVKKFAEAVQEARGLGLNDKLYKELLEKGPDALPFIEQLIASGATGVQEINELGVELENASSKLGLQAANGLYYAGIQSAQGIVEGLKTEQQNIEAQMEATADFMIDAIKNKLAIHSPSRVMAELGAYSGQGLVQGLDEAAPAVTASSTELGAQVIAGMVQGIDAGIPSLTAAATRVAQAALDAAKATLGVASPSKEFAKIGQWSSQGLANGLVKYSDRVASASAEVGKDAITAMSKSISGMSALVGADFDLNPVITPVLDLTSVKKDAALVGSMLATQALSVGEAYSSAQNASSGYDYNQQESQASYEPQPAPILNFTQNNTSPKALSAATLYRQTKNQLSTVKGALPTSAK